MKSRTLATIMLALVLFGAIMSIGASGTGDPDIGQILNGGAFLAFVFVTYQQSQKTNAKLDQVIERLPKPKKEA